MTARTAVLVTVSALLLGSLLNSASLAATARGQSPGWRRTVAVPVTDVLDDVSRTLWLDRPRAWIDDLRRWAAGGDTPRGTADHREVFVPTEDRPAHLWVAGDSLTDTLGPALVNRAESTGLIRARREAQYSSGLNRPVFDWSARIESELAAHPADIVVFMIGANDGVPVETATGWVGTDKPAWQEEYRRRVAATMSVLTARAATAYWVGLPVMRSASLSAKAAVMNEIFRTEAERHPGMRYVDSWSVLADASGQYDDYLPDASGRPELVRRSDGVHLTGPGADRLAAAVLRAIEREWRILSGS